MTICFSNFREVEEIVANKLQLNADEIHFKIGVNISDVGGLEWECVFETDEDDTYAFVKFPSPDRQISLNEIMLGMRYFKEGDELGVEKEIMINGRRYVLAE